MDKFENYYSRMLEWRERYITQRQFILFLSFLVGLFVSLAAFLLKTSIHAIHSFLDNLLADNNSVNYWYLFTPAIGILITMLFVRYVVKDNISHGVTRILYAISQRKSIIKLHNVWTSLVGSSITIGFGGSVGAEAPIVLTGSAIGSNLGKFFKMDQKTLMLLVGCGAAGAIGGIFKAPIAGLVFTLEVLMLDMTLTSIVPLLIASVTATSFTYFLTGSSFMFDFSVREAFVVQRIPFLILLGVVCGLVSLYFTRGMNWLEGLFRKIKNPFIKWAVGGSVLSLLIFIFPPLYGEGYEEIEAILNGGAFQTLSNSPFMALAESPYILLIYFTLIVAFKIFASASTTSAGGVGGIFAPSLFIGCFTGFAVAQTLGYIGFQVPESNFEIGRAHV